MKHFCTFSVSVALSVLLLGCSEPETLYVVTTGDVHGSFFDQPYVDGGGIKTSLMSVMHYVDSLRTAVGPDNVLLLDAGDVLQGDNATYYYNFVATDGEHLYSRIADYMDYDAVVMGNHDVETGHPVYDKVASELQSHGIAYLAGNYFKADGTPYFPEYKVFRRAGRKVLVLGYGNANIKAWLSEPLWSGMDFRSLLPAVQEGVDRVVAKEKPDVVIVVTHSGTGEGDGSMLESQGMDLFNTLHGVDVVVAAHDHSPYSENRDSMVLVNAGSRAGYVGLVTVSAGDGKTLAAKTVRLDKKAVDQKMEAAFSEDFAAVKAFTNRQIGTLETTMLTRDAYKGMCDYINLIHTVQLSVPEAEISFAAPLTYNGTIKSGPIVFNDLLTIYPYENQMFVVRLTGDEIQKFLEFSYDRWIQSEGEHVLRIENRPNARTDSSRWSFTGRSYNFDSAAGLVYTVDVTKPYGSRVRIISLAGGRAFDPSSSYNVAMTSYRANGGGETMPLGAGIPDVEADGRIVARYPEIRDLIGDYISKHGTITPELLSDPMSIGSWKFVPESSALRIEEDMDLLFTR